LGFFTLIIIKQQLVGDGRLQSKPSWMVNAAPSGMAAFYFAVGRRALDGRKHQQRDQTQGQLESLGCPRRLSGLPAARGDWGEISVGLWG